MRGLMMDMPLMISDLLRHAARHHGSGEVVSKTVEQGAVHRYTYRDAQRARPQARQRPEKARRCACTTGWRRWPGTATGTSRSTMRSAGSGAVIHTINPRLFADQIVYIVEPRRGQGGVRRPDLRAAGREARAAARHRCSHFVAMTDRAHLPRGSIPKLALPTRTCWSARPTDFDVARASTSARPRALCYTSGTTGNPKGVLYSPPLDRPARLRGRAARRAQPSRARRGAAGGADVPRQRLGHALRLRPGRRQAGLPGPAPRRQEPARAVRDAKGSHARAACRRCGSACSTTCSEQKLRSRR